jgi:DNA-binding transcriptional regulator GbsR (MarR family)
VAGVSPRDSGTAPASQDALLRFVERFAIVLAESGLQRMTARVFAYALADDADRYSASELADALRVSPAAVSGAVRELVAMGMLTKEREPGDRSDTYRLAQDIWYGMITQGEGHLEAMQRVSADGVKLLGTGTPGGRRVAETEEFCAFLRHELEQLTQRWHEHRQAAFGTTSRGQDEQVSSNTSGS